ncbi:protein kinase domain-containing protein [Micromonospora sp. LOL_024]|uniref:serine/threonine-protein kinase n=1 Tax=Micromonospora sp. LOL_024 TaxID=3345412 RepID=UPI003A88F8E9
MSEPAPQLVADRYRLISPLGQGGMGRVWRARDEVLHRDVAIKELVPPPGLTNDERREMRERSLREARAIARLNNVNVVRIFDVLRTDGDPWIVMEYVASRSLQDALAADGPVPSDQAVEIGLGVLNALKAAHKAGIMHRDVKPGNVLLGDDGRVVLTDFGLATIPGDPNVTRTGMVLGSPAYIAPERARDGTAGPEADLWSLGATLYAAVEGKSPFARPSAIGTLAALATEAVPPARNAGPLKQVLAGLLRKDPQERITAESAERMLRKASGRRARGISLLGGVRRPGPNGPREPRPTLVPAPRPSGERPATPVTPPAPRTPPASGPLAAAAADDSGQDQSTGTQHSSEAAATAKVALAGGSDAEPTAKVDAAVTGADGTSTATESSAGTTRSAQTDGPSDGAAQTDGQPAESGSRPADSATPPVVQTEPPSSGGSAPGNAAAAPKGQAGLRNTQTTPATATGDQATPDVTGLSTGESTGAAPQQPTSLMPAAPVSPGPVRGSLFTAGQFRSERTRRVVLVGALVAVLLLGLVVGVPLLTSGNDGDETPQGGAGTPTAPASASSEPAAPPPTGTLSPSASASPSISPSPTQPAGGVPPGWTLRTDPVGFKVPVPDGWRRSTNGTSVIYQEPDGVRELLIDRTDTPKRDAEADWRSIEPARKNLVRNYEFIGISPLDCKWRTCADWDWLEDRDNTRIRVRNRAFVPASNRGFALRWEVANKDWAANLDNFEMIFREFVPDRQD